MTAVRYVFWDSDNTLVDTAEMHWRKHVETLRSYGIVLDEKYRPRIYENNGGQNWVWFQDELGLQASGEDYLDKADTWYAAHIRDIVLRPGVAEALDIFARAGVPQAVVSNGRRPSVTRALEARALLRHMRFVITIEDCKNRKPHPEPYLNALKKMEEIEGKTILPETCLVIEDDPKGAQAGLAAGMQVLHRPPEDNDAEKFLARCKEFLSPSPAGEG